MEIDQVRCITQPTNSPEYMWSDELCYRILDGNNKPMQRVTFRPVHETWGPTVFVLEADAEQVLWVPHPVRRWCCYHWRGIEIVSNCYMESRWIWSVWTQFQSKQLT